MDADLTCEYCKGGGWFSDDAGRYRCQECWGHGRRLPTIAEWDALRAENEMLWGVLERTPHNPECAVRRASDCDCPRAALDAEETP